METNVSVLIIVVTVFRGVKITTTTSATLTSQAVKSEMFVFFEALYVCIKNPVLAQVSEVIAYHPGSPCLFSHV